MIPLPTDAAILIESARPGDKPWILGAHVWEGELRFYAIASRDDWVFESLGEFDLGVVR